MHQQLSQTDADALLALFVFGDVVSNPEIYKKFGLTITGKRRERLQDAGLINSWKVGRPFHIELTEEGWRWCEEELSTPAAKGALRHRKIEYAVHNMFQRFLRKRNLRLADVVLETLEDDQPEALSPTQLFEVYEKLASKPQGWVQLLPLREELNATRSDTDVLLRELFRSRRINLIPEDNQKTLTDADRRAAIRIGNDDKHLISIDERL